MNTFPTKHLMTVEHHCLQQRYQHLRLAHTGALEKLCASIEQHGQLVPVVLVPEAENQWVLIDGYLRVKALKRLGRDTVEAKVWECDSTQALLDLLKHHSGRALETFEEALFIHELHVQHGLTQNMLAARLGRDKSWVSRRLSLLEFLPEEVLHAVATGSISLWAATRVFVPLARANNSHVTALLKYLLNHAHSTRELQCFHTHYEKSNRQQREQLVGELASFFKAQQYMEGEKHSTALREGPEGKWQFQLRTVTALLSELIVLAPTILYSGQTPGERQNLLQGWKQAQGQWDLFTSSIGRLEHAHPSITPNDCLSLPERKERPYDSQVVECFKKHD